MRIIFMGTPDFAVTTLDALYQAGHEIVLVVTQPDKPKGRKGQPQFSDVKTWAVAHDLPVFQPERIRLPENVEELTGEDMPEPKEYMKQQQRNGKDFCAEDVYKETWEWLKGRGCEKLVNPQLVSQYAMTVARWIQCEEAISEYGFIAKHPTTNAAIASPYVSMSQNYMKQVNQLWYQIYQIVKENCLTDYGGQTPQDDAMERLLRARKGMN